MLAFCNNVLALIVCLYFSMISFSDTRKHYLLMPSIYTFTHVPLCYRKITVEVSMVDVSRCFCDIFTYDSTYCTSKNLFVLAYNRSIRADQQFKLKISLKMYTPLTSKCNQIYIQSLDSIIILVQRTHLCQANFKVTFMLIPAFLQSIGLW